jgi:general secretion pathway protein L
MSLLIVQLPPRPRLGAQGLGPAAPGPQAVGEYAHVLSSDGRSVDAEGRAPAALLPAATSTVLVLAATDVAFHRIAVPKAPAARLRAALRGVLEERLLDDIDAAHLALAPGAAGGTDGWVAVTDRAWLQAQVARIEAAGRAVDRIACAVWPRPIDPTGSDASGGEIDVTASLDALADASAEHALVTLASADGVACCPWQPDQGRPSGLATAWAGAPAAVDWPASASPAFVQATEAWLGRRVDVRTPAQRLLAAAQSDWNLRQFDLAARHRGATWLRDTWARFQLPAWRPVRWGLVGLVAAQLVGLNAWAWQQRSELQARRTAMDNLLRSTHPQVRAVLDAPVQMRRENEALRAAAGRAGDSDLEPMLQAAASGWPENLPVQTLRYDNGQLSLGAPQLGPDQVERLRSVLQPAGWRIESQGSALTLRRAP